MLAQKIGRSLKKAHEGHVEYDWGSQPQRSWDVIFHADDPRFRIDAVSGAVERQCERHVGGYVGYGRTWLIGIMMDDGTVGPQRRKQVCELLAPLGRFIDIHLEPRPVKVTGLARPRSGELTR